MKIAKYKGMFYRYISNNKACSIVTTRNEKAQDGFVLEDGVYYKTIPDDDVSDIFEIRYRVKHDTGIPDVSDEWEIGAETQDVKEDKILIRYSNGILPEWTVEEKNVCIKYVDKKEIEFGEIIRLYQKKNGRMLTSPEKVVEKVDVDTFIRIQFGHQRNNL